jgi:hypothetical protein
MVFKSIVHRGAIALPPNVCLPDGTVVQIEADVPKRFRHLLDLAGTWKGDDAERIVQEIYASRSSSPARTSFDR